MTHYAFLSVIPTLYKSEIKANFKISSWQATEKLVK